MSLRSPHRLFLSIDAQDALGRVPLAFPYLFVTCFFLSSFFFYSVSLPPPPSVSADSHAVSFARSLIHSSPRRTLIARLSAQILGTRIIYCWAAFFALVMTVTPTAPPPRPRTPSRRRRTTDDDDDDDDRKKAPHTCICTTFILFYLCACCAAICCWALARWGWGIDDRRTFHTHHITHTHSHLCRTPPPSKVIIPPVYLYEDEEE